MGQGKVQNGKARQGRPTKKKTAKKTAKRKRCISPRSGQELPAGNPGNSGGKKGRSGRKPDEFKALMRELASNEDTLKSIRSILKDADHSAFVAAWRQAAAYGYGQPAQKVEHSGGVTHSADERVQRILELLANAKSRKG